MTALPVTFSEDQASAFDRITEMLRAAGVDIELAREALRLAEQKLPISTKFTIARDYKPE